MLQTATKRPGSTQPRIITHTVGPWSWNHDKLLSKLIKTDNADECWGWRGAQSPASNLFGGYKNDRAQMCQTNRFLVMAQTGQNIDDKCVYMRCGNYHCSNPSHFYIQDKVGGRKRDIYV